MKEAILKALSYVEDPDLKKDLVSLGMIKNLLIQDKKVSFDLELTTPACPMKDMLLKACTTAIHTMVDQSLELQINLTSRVSTSRMDGEVLKDIRNIIAIASGKGGVGKSTVAVNIARSLQSSGARVGILDADIHGPSVPVLMAIQDERPQSQESKLIPIEKDGIKVMSIGFLVPPTQAIVWRGPMLASALKQFVNDVIWGELDYLIVDLPPGTGDIHLSMAQLIPLTGIVMVTTPEEVALADARKAMDMFNNPQLKKEILGVVENMSYFSPRDMPDKKYYLFGRDGGSKLASEFGVDLLGQIPMFENMAENTVETNLSEIANVYKDISGRIVQKISIINATILN